MMCQVRAGQVLSLLQPLLLLQYVRSMHGAMLAHLACLNDLILYQQVMHSLEHALQNAPEDVVRCGIHHKVLSLHCILLRVNP